MTTAKILLIMFTIIMLIISCVLLNCFNTRGKKIIKLKESITLFWYVIFGLFIILFILELIMNLKYYHGYFGIMMNMVEYFFYIICSFNNSLIVKLSNTITEKGIYIDIVYSSWKKIESYRWIDENTLEFRIKIIKKYKNKRLEVDLDVNRTEVDKILKGYIKENKEEME